jgi:hypothetical protein
MNRKKFYLAFLLILGLLVFVGENKNMEQSNRHFSFFLRD